MAAMKTARVPENAKTASNNGVQQRHPTYTRDIGPTQSRTLPILDRVRPHSLSYPPWSLYRRPLSRAPGGTLRRSPEPTAAEMRSAPT